MYIGRKSVLLGDILQMAHEFAMPLNCRVSVHGTSASTLIGATILFFGYPCMWAMLPQAYNTYISYKLTLYYVEHNFVVARTYYICDYASTWH